MKKLTCLVLALALVFSVCSALAATEIDGLTERNITINPAGLNPSAEEMIEEGISPTTGRYLDEIEYRDGFVGTAVTGVYQPIMVQISNAKNGIGFTDGTNKPYRYAPVNGTYADVVYEAPQKRSGSETRMSMIFSDVVPDYVGYLRSTRVTHCRLRQEWECAFCTSGYVDTDVPAEWKALGVKNPQSSTKDDPGIVYVGDYQVTKPYGPYVWRINEKAGPNNEVFQLAAIVQNIIPKDHVPANHTFKFTDDIPQGGDNAEFVYVTFGDLDDTDSRLEYSADDNAYIRYVFPDKKTELPYMDTTLLDTKVVDPAGRLSVKSALPEPVETFMFSNVIVQSVHFEWPKGRPAPELVGTGNADYFMCGKHFAGVWERTDYNSRTVFYGEDGNEIEMQRGKTLIILMDYAEKYSGGKLSAGVAYE